MYTQTATLKDHESLAVLDKTTGEIREVGKRASHIPDGMSLFSYAEFSKMNNKAVSFLSRILTNEELGVVFRLIEKADYGTNSLLPLNDEMSMRELEGQLKVHRAKLRKILDKLFELGVYAHVRVRNGEVSEYWILNPFIVWRGKVIENSIRYYFCDTVIAKACS